MKQTMNNWKSREIMWFAGVVWATQLVLQLALNHFVALLKG